MLPPIKGIANKSSEITNIIERTSNTDLIPLFMFSPPVKNTFYIITFRLQIIYFKLSIEKVKEFRYNTWVCAR
ncbi:hypothetical protein HB162lentus_19240 [Mammaliicoccus lentus]